METFREAEKLPFPAGGGFPSSLSSSSLSCESSGSNCNKSGRENIEGRRRNWKRTPATAAVDRDVDGYHIRIKNDSSCRSSGNRRNSSERTMSESVQQRFGARNILIWIFVILTRLTTNAATDSMAVSGSHHGIIEAQSLSLREQSFNLNGVVGHHQQQQQQQEHEPFLLNEIEEDVHSAPSIEVESLVGGRAEFPCDVNPLPDRRDDSVHMVLWFRDDFGKPIYSLDVRGKPLEYARHWSFDKMFGNRAHFRVVSDPKKPARLVIDNVKLTDEGVYRCRIDFRNSPTRHYRFNLSVIVPPESLNIYDSSGRLLTSTVGPLREGSDLSISCKVSGGNPKPRILWRMREEIISMGEPTIRQNDNVLVKTLKISQLKREHHGANLTCLTLNSNSTQPLTESIRIVLYLSPLSARITEKERLVANQRHQIECIATGSRPQAMITWWMGSKQLTDVNILKDDEIPVTHRIAQSDEVENNITRSTLGIVPSIEDDGQKITCRAENPWVPRSFVEDSRIFHVVYPPVALLKLGSALQQDEIKEGDDVYFECHLKSNPPHLKLEWMRNNEPLQHNVTAGIILSNQSLVLQLVTRKSAGNYTCVASNAIGTTVSNVFSLRVKYSPVCKNDKPVIVGVSKGEHISIKCELDADPEHVSFTWYLAASGQMVEVPSYRYSNKGATSILHYSPISNLDYGSLFCRGSNAVGAQLTTQSCVFQVVAAEKPSPVTNCTAFNETAESVELSCDEGHDGGLPQHFVLEVVEVDTSEVRYNASSNTASFHLGNLTPSGTGFRAFIYAVNSKGRSEPYQFGDLVRQMEKTTAPTPPKEYSWFSFVISAAIGGIAVFICVGAGVVLRVYQLRSRSSKKNLSMKVHDECQKNSRGNLQDGQVLDSKDGISSDDKDPDIIPSNIGGADHSTLPPSIMKGSNNPNGGGGGGDRGLRYTTTTMPMGPTDYCLQSSIHYPVETSPHSQQQVQYPPPPIAPSSHHNIPHYSLTEDHAIHSQQQINHPHHQYVIDPCEVINGRITADGLRSTTKSPYNTLSSTSNYQFRVSGNTPLSSKSANYNTLGSHPHQQHHHPHQTTTMTTSSTSTEPFYDPKQMKQKLLSINVPESCV